MQVDWFTVVAEIGNFLILVYLLKRFLYGPIVRIIDEREQKIDTWLKEAEKKREQAEGEADRYQREIQRLQARREEMLDQAKEEAEAQRKKLLQAAREEVDRTQARWQEAIQQERESLLRELSKQVMQQSTEVARRALADLANAPLGEQMVEAFIRHLQGLTAEDKEKIASSIRESGGEAILRSAFVLPEETQKKLIGALRDKMFEGNRLTVRFEVSPELIAGIELEVRGYQVAWTVESYLQSLEERVAQALKGRMATD